MKNARRLGIFFFYDKDGIVDSYVDYLLNDISKSFDKLIVVSNGALSCESLRLLSMHTDHVIIRENKGFDVWAYKAAIDYCGWKEIDTYYEIVLFNFTIMGPLYSFVDVFHQMDQCDIDFWGLNVHYGVDYDPTRVNPYGYLPKHLQSHFVAFRNRILNSKEFHKYWDELPEIRSYDDAVGKHESYLTKHFEDQGFTWTAYIKTDDLSNRSEYPLIDYPVEVLRDYHCPIFKRKSFFVELDHFSQRGAWSDAGRSLFTYLRDETDFDTEMIVTNMVRTQKQHEYSYPLCLIDSLKPNIPRYTHKLAVFVNINGSQASFDCNSIIHFFPENTDFFVVQNDAEALRTWENLYTGSKASFDNYEFVCVVAPCSVMPGFNYAADKGFRRALDRLIGSKSVVESIIGAFEVNARVGVITSARPKSMDAVFQYSYLETLNRFMKEKTFFQDAAYIHSGNAVGVYWIRSASLNNAIRGEFYSSFRAAHYKGDFFDLLLPYIVKENGYVTHTIVTFDDALNCCTITQAQPNNNPATFKEKLKRTLPNRIVVLIKNIKKRIIKRHK